MFCKRLNSKLERAHIGTFNDHDSLIPIYAKLLIDVIFKLLIAVIFKVWIWEDVWFAPRTHFDQRQFMIDKVKEILDQTLKFEKIEITYKSLSRKSQVSVRKAKEFLAEYHQKHPELAATFAVQVESRNGWEIKLISSPDVPKDLDGFSLFLLLD